MINTQQIIHLASFWWKDILRSSITGEPFFPKAISRIGKIKPGETLRDFEKIQAEIHELREHSKEKRGYGYSIIWKEVENRKVGRNQFPDRIVFETLDDYLRFSSSQKSYYQFIELYTSTIEKVPELRSWMFEFPEQVVKHRKQWEDLLKVCLYFKTNPNPAMYVRQLPIDVHTKFIEENSSILTSLLDALIPATIREGKTFSRRFNLLFDEPLVRVRLLDYAGWAGPFSDISIPVSQFRNVPNECITVLITENKMNFLMLPKFPNTIAVWSGGGFNIKYLANVDWLKKKRMIYWGDIDAHGFVILNQLRQDFPQSKSVMMDWDTFNDFGKFTGAGERVGNISCDKLSDGEMTLFLHVKENMLRLEQEKISFPYAVNKLTAKVFEGTTESPFQQ